MRKQGGFVGSILIAATIVTIGLGGDFAQANQIGINGNHFGWEKNGNDQSSLNIGQNGNNGNHYGWDKNLKVSSITQTTSSVSERASLILLGAALAGVGILRRL